VPHLRISADEYWAAVDLVAEERAAAGAATPFYQVASSGCEPSGDRRQIAALLRDEYVAFARQLDEYLNGA